MKARKRLREAHRPIGMKPAGVATVDASVRMQEPISPSGEQVELSVGDQRVVVVGFGGGLRRVLHRRRVGARRLQRRHDVRLRPRAAARALAEPDPGRQLRVRGRELPAGARRARAQQRDPRARALVEVVGRRAGGGPRGARAPAAPDSGLPVHARSPGRVHAGRRRPHRARGGDERRGGRVPVRLRRASIPRGRRRPCGRARAARSGRDGADLRRALDPHWPAVGRRHGARLPNAEADRRGAARPLLHRSPARRRRPCAGRARRSGHALGRRELSVRDGLHRRCAAGRRAAQRRRRADDVRAERVPKRRRPDPPRARGVALGQLGDRPALG